MDDSAGWLWVIILILILLSAFFSASETAYSSVNKIRLRNMVKNGDKRAARALKIAEKYDKALSTILVGNNIVNIASASLGTLLFTKLFGPSGVGISTIVMTIVVLIFGEVLPKSFAKDNADAFALTISAPLSGFMWICTPIVFLFVQLKKLVSRFTHSDQSHPSVTEEELKVIVEEIQGEGVLEEQESELVQSALDFDEITADEILTPRVDVVMVELHEDIEKIKMMFVTERFSRFLVYEKNVDNVLGILHEKDFFKYYVKTGTVDVANILQKTIFVPPKKKISELLRELQHEKCHIAVVTDQYGGMLGIITLEDILEELVGEIWDEDDEVIHDVVPTGPDTYQVNPDISVEDLFEAIDFEPGDFETDASSIGGWAFETLGKIPDEGESFGYQNLTLTVERVEDQRITAISLRIHPKDTFDQDNHDAGAE